MAQMFPTIEKILEFRVAPEPGEIYLLEFLSNHLDDEYEIYFNPFLNGDRPDIVIMRKGSGVLIIEVKDWQLDNYTVEDDVWRLRANNARIKSPVAQVKAYKDNLFNLHIERLLDMKVTNKKYYAIISCAVYFHNSTIARLGDIGKNADRVDILARDSLTEAGLSKLLDRTWLNKSSRIFDDEIYLKFKKYLQPPAHTMEQGREFEFVGRQVELIKSAPVQRKIRGVAGSGKTTVLAKRAVNAFLRTQSRVLILTYNITLRNYIHDKISDVRGIFHWNSFYIMHYHLFFVIEANNHNLEVNLDRQNFQGDFNNEFFFESVRDELVKYDSIFIDEIQDYEETWIRLIKRYFLNANGEFVVVGDEKQNVYDRDIDQDRRPNTTIPGRWNELNDAFRCSSEIINLAFEFQDFFFKGKYDLDEINIAQGDLFDQRQTVYYNMVNYPNLKPAYQFTEGILNKMNVHANDVTFLASKVELLREMEYLYRIQRREKTAITFENKEEYDIITNNKNYDAAKKEMEIIQIQRTRKFQFWMNTGTAKFSTIHSFKGWEIHTLILLIDGEDNVDELIYTAITRSKHNLIICNLNNIRYDRFFTKYIAQVSSVK